MSAPDLPARIAAAALAGAWDRAELTARLAEHCVPDPVAADELARRLMDHSPRQPTGTVEEFARLVRALPPRPEPAAPATPAAWRWPVPRWQTPVEVAQALGLTAGELDWFADRRGWNRRAAGPLRHYDQLWVPTRSGGARLIEAPKPRLAELQRRLLRHVLAEIPVHDAAHGFRAGRSPATYAAPHAGRALVVRVDLESFFTTISGARVAALLRVAGYPEPVARTLAGLATTATPADVLRTAPAGHWRQLRALAAPHLPQGAPTSPALANAVAYRPDVRLAGLARLLGARYTRYADDLAFSGPSNLPLHRLLPGVRAIAADEGFRVRRDKTRTSAAHQRQRLAGLVVNARPAVAREEYDALRALLHNCARTGPEEQNRADHPDFRAHLLGRIAHVGATAPHRAAKLRTLFDSIPW